MRLFRYLRCCLFHSPAWFLVMVNGEWSEWDCNRCGRRWFNWEGKR